MINPQNNDVTVAGTDLFADSESFLHELTDSELVQVTGGVRVEVSGGSIFDVELSVGDDEVSVGILG